MENSIDILPNDNQLQLLVESISEAIKNARVRLASHINTTMTETYWQIGKYIVEYEQGGAAKVAYGTSTLTQLSKQLTARFGRGFSRPNLVNMRKFYLYYPNCQTVSDNLIPCYSAFSLPQGRLLSKFAHLNGRIYPTIILI